jgi:transcriptional regulator
MHRPPHFQPRSQDDALKAIEAWPLATLITDGLAATHLPMLLKGDVLTGHIARANPHWQQSPNGAKAIAIFHGPSTYVSPGFFATKREHGRVVPTWNYVAVHVHGSIAWIDDADRKRAIVRELTDRFEAAEAKPWSIDDAPESYIDAMLRGIVGVRVHIERIESQFKLSQNRTEDDRSGTELGLDARSDSGSRAIAALMRDQGSPPSG